GDYMRRTKILNLLFAVMMCSVVALGNTQDPSKSTSQTNPDQQQQSQTPSTRQRTTEQKAVDQKPADASKADASRAMKIESGRKQKVNGVIVKRDVESFIMRDENGSDVTVNITGSTKVTERKSNPFRGAKNFGVTSLLRGLAVEVEGHGGDSGALVADKI